MSRLKCITKVFESAEQIPFDNSSKIVLISDCHRGDGNWADDFSKNQNLYYAALTYYYNQKYIYIELGDGDELWENKSFYDIVHIHSDAFSLLKRFYNEERAYFIYGNHDMVKKNNDFVKNNLYEYYDERQKKNVPLFKNIKLHEGLILRHKVTNDKILLIHGHQADYLNSTLWKISRFLVRYLWKPLESYGVNDPTSAAKNYEKKEAVGKKLTEWVVKEKHVLIAGHTHRPIFPETNEPPYFNDGSCVHPRCITAIEINLGSICLVKWTLKTKFDGTLFIGREVLAGPRKLQDYFKYK